MDYKNSKFIINNCIKEISEISSYLDQDKIIIYEVVRLIENNILFFEDHLERLFNSYNHLKIRPKLSREEIRNELQLLIQSNKIKNGNIKFQFQIDKKTYCQDFISFFIPHSYPTTKQYNEGIEASIINASRINPNAKIQDTSLRDISNQTIHNEKVYEVLLVNSNGFITEGSRSNLFMIKDNVVKTPPKGDILPGITRKYVILACNELKIDCLQTQITVEEMLTMDALFISGTSPKVLPINSIGTRRFDINNACLRSIIKKFDEIINIYLKR